MHHVTEWTSDAWLYQELLGYRRYHFNSRHEKMDILSIAEEDA